ncbi:unnamed protein product, partial [Meganyctiphanes norvegica]
MGDIWPPNTHSSSAVLNMEFPSQRKEKIDWHKLASIDFHDLSSGCSIEVLQENLSHITFCDAESEFDVSTASGQKTLLKVFRLSQLMIQYLFISQEFIENELQQSQSEVQQVKAKTQEIKAKLIQQVEEAKKMKASNRNMRETVKYVNSVALSNGLFQMSKCQMCGKTFRSQNFLRAHVYRKHPEEAHTYNFIKDDDDDDAGTANMFRPSEPVPQLFFQETKSQDMLSGKNVMSPNTEITTKTNDVDSYRMEELENKLTKMNEHFLKVVRDVESQKMRLEHENELRKDEIKSSREEKSYIENKYELKLQQLHKQISVLQEMKQQRENNINMNNKMELLKQKDIEIKHLQREMKKQKDHKTKDKNLGIHSENLKYEIENLRLQLEKQKQQSKNSFNEMHNSLQGQYESKLEQEREKYEEMLHDTQNEFQNKMTSPMGKPPLSSSRSVTNKKPPPTPNRNTKPSVLTGSSSTTQHNKVLRKKDMNKMDIEDSETESESETETSYWDAKLSQTQKMKINKQNSEDDIKYQSEETMELSESEEISEESASMTDSESYEDINDEDGSSESLTLEMLLKDNPKLWSQMRNATSEVLAAKISNLGISSAVTKLKSDALNAAFSKMRKDRKKQEQKHNNYFNIRKKLEIEIKTRVANKLENENNTSVLDSLDTTPKKTARSSSGMLSRAVKNVKSRVREGSKAISSSVSKTGGSMSTGIKDILQTSSRSKDQVKVLSTSSNKHSDVESNNSSDDDSNSESEESISAHVDVHHETSKTVSRNLFNEPLDVSTGARQKHGSYFENKTYGNRENSKLIEDDDSVSEWDTDSEPEYENTKIQEPPERSDSLNYAGIIQHHYDEPKSDWDAPGPSMPIKLKKPTGDKVSSLSRSIELQLSGRRKTNMAGAVDTMGGVAEPRTSTPKIKGDVSDSSNTVNDSMWGSADTMQHKDRYEQPIKSTKMSDTWDSDELNISDVE